MFSFFRFWLSLPCLPLLREMHGEVEEVEVTEAVVEATGVEEVALDAM